MQHFPNANANSPLPAWIYGHHRHTQEIQRKEKSVKVPNNGCRSSNSDRQPATIGLVGRTTEGQRGGLSHNRENDPECYKSTKFPPVTQHVSASFVSCNSFFLLLLKRHFFPNSLLPCGKYIAQKYKWRMLLNIYIYLYMYIYAIDLQIRRFCSNTKERGSALTECSIRAELCP